MERQELFELFDKMCEEAEEKISEIEGRLLPEDYAIRKDVADYYRLSEIKNVLNSLKGLIEK